MIGLRSFLSTNGIFQSPFPESYEKNPSLDISYNQRTDKMWLEKVVPVQYSFSLSN